MKTPAICLLAVALATAVSAQTPPATPAPPAPLPSVKLSPALDRVLRDYERAWTARDPAALSALFTEDGFVLSNGKPPVRGRAAIRAAYANAGGPLLLRALAYSTDGRTGYIIGAYRGAEDQPDEGKFVLAIRRNDAGRWLIAADMDNTNRPPRPAPPRTPSPVPTAPAS